MMLMQLCFFSMMVLALDELNDHYILPVLVEYTHNIFGNHFGIPLQYHGEFYESP